ncbi:helix-turn-helix domain-containing protein [Streptomyces sp. DSM 116494]|uniref:helix-turn-helix transcriptional regulator n=1 Tax=Streptomyces okerensis TaxID=3344655 RepID=UPI00388CEF73
MIEFARRLRALRKAAGLTLNELAQRTHYSKSTLSAAAGGHRLPSWDVAWAYVAACDRQQSQTAWSQRWQDAGRAERVHRAEVAPLPLSADRTGCSVQEFAAALRARIEAGGHSLASAAKAAGHSRSTVAKDAQGKTLGSWPRVRDVLQAVGVEPTLIDRKWRPLWESARQCSQQLQPRAAAPAAAVERAEAPAWLRAAQAAVWPHLQIRDPMSERGQVPLLGVPFTDAGGNLSDSWEVINGPRGGHTLSFTGRGDDIVGVYRSLTSRRLVLLGAAGAGSSNLARRLGLELLRGEDPQPVVPVLLPLASWEISEGQPFDSWLLRHVSEALGDLARPVMQHQALLPILDGFHTLPTALRIRALVEIDAALAADAPVVLTSTLDAYAAAVEAADTVITGSAALRVLPLDATALAAFLPRGHRNPEQAARAWEAVWPALDDRAELMAVLAEPVMAAAARHLYSETRADPGELLDVSRIPDPAALRTRLAEHGIAVAYARPASGTGEAAALHGQDAQTRAEQQERTLRGLVHDIADTSSSVLRLSAVRPRSFDAALAAVTATVFLLLLAMTVVGVLERLAGDRFDRTASWQFLNTMAVMGTGLGAFWGLRSNRPQAYRLRLPGTGASGSRPRAPFVAGPSSHQALLAFGCLTLLSLGEGSDGDPFMVAAITAPVVYLLAKGILTEPADDGDYPTPRALRRTDLTARTFVGTCCTLALAGAIDFIALSALIIILARSTFIRYHISALGLRARTNIPDLTLTRVLDDACNRGLVRRSGTLYHLSHPAYASVLTRQPTKPLSTGLGPLARAGRALRRPDSQNPPSTGPY